MKLGVIGAGFSGREIGKLCASQGVTVWGTTRSQENFSTLMLHDINPVIFRGDVIAPDMRQHLKDTTHLVISIAPPREEASAEEDKPVDPTMAALAGEALMNLAPKLEWIGYLSTVGVYGNHDGAWVDETQEATPASQRSRQRIRAEAEWQALGNEIETPVAIFRLSGIYGPGRNALINAEKGKSRRLVKKGQVFNRIHVGDIAKAVFLAIQKQAAGIFNITDDEPAPPQDVVTFAHKLLGTMPPEEIDFETADLTPMARSFYGENKRVSNEKSKKVLGLVYEWPNYRDALTRMWKEDLQRG